MLALPSRAASWMANLFCVCDIFVLECTEYSVQYSNLCEWIDGGGDGVWRLEVERD